MDSESPILAMIHDYGDSSFFIDSNPPFITLCYYYISEVFGGKSLPVLSYRYFNVILGTVTVLVSYKILKCMKISSNIALWGALVLSLENATLMEQRMVTVYPFYLFLLSLFFYYSKASQNVQLFTFGWWKRVLATSILLGLLLASHWTAPMALVFSIYLSGSELWNTIDDLSIPVSQLYASFFTKIVSNVTISLTVYLAVWKVHFNLLTDNGRGYNLVSPKFQNSLHDSHLRFLNEEILFGSKVMLRNLKTRNYLHSHDDVFRTGHQQVTGHWNFNDAENLFQIQSSDFSKDVGLLLETEFKVQHPFKVKLYHDSTDSYLRISPDSRPPISEQDYNSEVTTNKGIKVAEGDDDSANIVFQLRINKDYSWDAESTGHVKALRTLFQIYNEKNNCYVLSNGIELTDGQSSGQTELICIKEPAVEASLWYIDWSQHPKNANKSTVKVPEITFWEKLYEVLQVMMSDNIHGKKGLRLTPEERHNNAAFGGKFSDLMYAARGFEIWNNGSRVLYQICNVFTANSIIVAIAAFGIILSIQFVVWNPFDSAKAPVNPVLKEFNRQTFDLFVGYFLSIIPLQVVEHPIFTASYIPGTFFGIMILTETVGILIYYSKVIGVTVLAILTPLIFLSFWRFYPIIYGTPWTFEGCRQLILLSGWNREICNVYS